MFRNEHNYKDFIAGAVLGGTLGAMTALMFTEPGKKLKKDFFHKLQALEKKAEMLGKKAMKQVNKHPEVKKVIKKALHHAKVAKKAAKSTVRKAAKKRAR